MLNTRLAKASDIAAFYGRPLECSARALVVENGDSEVVLVAGVLHTEPLTAFMEMRDTVRESPRVLIRGIPLFRQILGQYSAPILAQANPDEPGAGRYLARVGFREVAQTSDRRVFVWRQ